MGRTALRGEVLLDLRRGWLFRARGDVGGFSIGTNLSVSAAVEAQYAVTDWLNFHIGWALYYADFPYEGTDAKLVLQGPNMGFGLPLFRAVGNAPAAQR